MYELLRTSVIVTVLTTFNLALTYLISEVLSEEVAGNVDDDVLMPTDETAEGICIY